jgi:Class III cytochrome C family/Ferric reductase like transmembrane component
VTEAPWTLATIGWEVAQALGALAVAGCLFLCLRPVRPRIHGSRPLSLRNHELAGWLVLLVVVVHALLLLRVDRSVIEHVRWTAPLYEWAGILGVLLLLLLTAPSTGAIRGRLWSRHRNFQALHVGMSCLLVALICVHVVTTNRYVHGPVRTASYLILSAAALLALLRARVPADPGQRPLRFSDRLAFGPHSFFVLALVLITVLASFAAATGRGTLALRAPLLSRNEPLRIDFPHDKHRAVNCIQCHHNFADRSGAASCVSCHRSGRTDIRVGAEARFHNFCLNCHRDPPPRLLRHGPVTGCDVCHVPAGAERPAAGAP